MNVRGLIKEVSNVRKLAQKTTAINMKRVENALTNVIFRQNTNLLTKIRSAVMTGNLNSLNRKSPPRPKISLKNRGMPPVQRRSGMVSKSSKKPNSPAKKKRGFSPTPTKRKRLSPPPVGKGGISKSLSKS